MSFVDSALVDDNGVRLQPIAFIETGNQADGGDGGRDIELSAPVQVAGSAIQPAYDLGLVMVAVLQPNFVFLAYISGNFFHFAAHSDDFFQIPYVRPQGMISEVGQHLVNRCGDRGYQHGRGGRRR